MLVERRDGERLPVARVIDTPYDLNLAIAIERESKTPTRNREGATSPD